jgi:hypothetical protein
MDVALVAVWERLGKAQAHVLAAMEAEQPVEALVAAQAEAKAADLELKEEIARRGRE